MDATVPCTCCTTLNQYIREHLDPEGLTRSDEDPAAVLAIFRRCFPGEDLGIDVDDVADYLESR